jgi:hypothetical protein
MRPVFWLTATALGAVTPLVGCSVDSHLQCGDACAHGDGAAGSDDGSGGADASDDLSMAMDGSTGQDVESGSQCTPGVACQVQSEAPATCCGSLKCNAATTCQTSCQQANAGCMGMSDCCYGLRCAGGNCVCTPTGSGCNEDPECCSFQCSSHMCR